MSFSAHMQADLLKLYLNATAIANIADNAASSPFTTTEVSIQTADPGYAGTMATSEIAYIGYARVSIARTTGGWTISGSGPTVANPVALIGFPATPGSGVTTQSATNLSVGNPGGGSVDYFLTGAITPPIRVTNSRTPELTTATTLTVT